MNLTDWSTIVSAIVAVATVFTSVLAFVVRHWIKDQLKELRPNGGGSTYDIIRKAAFDAQRAANAAEQAAVYSVEASEQIGEIIGRVSALEQAVIAIAIRKPAVRKIPSNN
jgi:hypothetical protein